MNTIFKFYNQAWLLFAVTAACSLYYFLEHDSAAEDASRTRAHHPHRRALPRPAELEPPALPPRALEAGFARMRRSLRFGRRRPEYAYLSVDGLGRMASFPEEVMPDHTEAPTSSPDLVVNRPPAEVEARPPRATPRVVALFERRRLWGATLAVLLAGSLIYTYAGTISRETSRSNWLPASSVPFTLDGMAFMKVAYPEDYAAITWLNEHVTGAPVIAEADGTPRYVGTYYDWRSRVSQFTGLPEILSGIHEGEQRWQDEIDPSVSCASLSDPTSCLQSTHSRIYDLNALYSSSNPAEAWRVIRKYGVRYIYVGFSERQCTSVQCYSRAGLAKFDAMAGHGLRVAFRRGSTVIYEVTRA